MLCLSQTCHDSTRGNIDAIPSSLSFFPDGGWFPVTREALLMKISTATDDTKLTELWERERKTYTLILLCESENYPLFYLLVLSEFRC